jgi:hypothetical protein
MGKLPKTVRIVHLSRLRQFRLRSLCPMGGYCGLGTALAPDPGRPCDGLHMIAAIR